jgi:hypothetical protein
VAKAKVIDVDFDDYDESRATAGYNGDEPRRGIYDGRLVSFKEHKSGAGNDGLEWIFEIQNGDFKGWRGWVYSNMDTSKWKTQQIVAALNGGSKKKTKLLPEPVDGNGAESKTVKKAGPVRLAIRQEKYQDESRGKIRMVMPPDGSNSDEEDEDDPDV